MKNDVNVPSTSNKQKKTFLLVNLRVTDEKTRIRDTGYTEHRISSK